MNRRAFVTGLGAVLAAPRVAEAQQATMVRVGVLWIASRDQNLPFIRSLEEGFRKLGYLSGQSIVIEHRFADGKPERLADLVRELLRLNVKVLVVGTNAGAMAARDATKTIPIVTVTTTDPVGAGLAKS